MEVFRGVKYALIPSLILWAFIIWGVHSAFGEEPIIARAGEVIFSDSPTPTVPVIVPSEILSATIPLVLIGCGKGIVFVRETTTTPMLHTVTVDSLIVIAAGDTAIVSMQQEVPSGYYMARDRQCSRVEMYVSDADTVAVLTDVDGSQVICWANKVRMWVGGVK